MSDWKVRIEKFENHENNLFRFIAIVSFKGKKKGQVKFSAPKSAKKAQIQEPLYNAIQKIKVDDTIVKDFLDKDLDESVLKP